MKQILAILTLIASLTFTSCEDFLTEEVRGQPKPRYLFPERRGSRVIHHRLLPSYHFWWLVEH